MQSDDYGTPHRRRRGAIPQIELASDRIGSPHIDVDRMREEADELAVLAEALETGSIGCR